MGLTVSLLDDCANNYRLQIYTDRTHLDAVWWKEAGLVDKPYHIAR